MQNEVFDGLALLLGALLAAGGASKLFAPRAFAHAVHRLLPAWLPRRDAMARAAAPVLGAVEVASGAMLAAGIFGPRPLAIAAHATAALLFTAFVGVVVTAIRKGASCGCFASFSDGVAGGAELGRAGALALLAWASFVHAFAAPPAGWRWPALAWATAGGLVVVLATLLGARALPKGSVVRPRGASTRADFGRRATGFVALLLGRVRSDKSITAVPSALTLSRDVVAGLAAEALSARTGAAVIAQLGERVCRLDWEGAEVRETTVDLAAARFRCILLTPSTVDGLTLTASLAVTEAEGGALSLQGSDVTFVGVLDGRPVLAAGGAVNVAPPTPLSQDVEAIAN